MADSLPWFKVYAAETLSDERFSGWTIEERGAWFTLLVHAWREGSIPSDQTSLARLLHVDATAMRSLWSAIGDRFVEHLDEPNRLTSPRLEREREDGMRMLAKKRAAGTAGATSRWSKGKKLNSSRMATACANSAEPMRIDGASGEESAGKPQERRAAEAPLSRLNPRADGEADRLAMPPAENLDALPATAAVLRALHAAGKAAAAPAREPRTRRRDEELIASVGVETATARVLAVWNPARTTLGWYSDAIIGATTKPGREPRRGMAPPSTDHSSPEATTL